MYTSAGMTVPMYAGAPDYTEDAPQPVNMALGFEGRKQWLSDALELWRKHYSRHEEGEGEEGEGEGEGQADPFMRWGQSLLWMSVISLHVDVQDLNDAAGRESLLFCYLIPEPSALADYPFFAARQSTDQKPLPPPLVAYPNGPSPRTPPPPAPPPSNSFAPSAQPPRLALTPRYAVLPPH